MPFCNQCGSGVGQDSRYCEHCGTAIHPASSAFVRVPPYQREDEGRLKPALRRTGVVVAAVLLVFVVIGIVFSAIPSSPQPADTENPVLVPVPDSLVDTGKSLPTVDSSLRGNDGQVKRVSGIRHIQVEKVLGPIVFEHNQGEDALFVFVSEDSVGSDTDFYGIALSESRGRSKDRSVVFFYSDIQDAEDASCYKEPDKNGFQGSCDGILSTQYSSLMARVFLEEESRSLTRYSSSSDALAAGLERWGWGDSSAIGQEYETILVYEWSATDLGDVKEVYVFLPDPGDRSDFMLCTIAHGLYRDQGQGADDFIVMFLDNESPAVRRARTGDVTAKLGLVQERLAWIGVEPEPSLGMPSRHFGRVGPWDDNTPFPTCESSQPKLGGSPEKDPVNPEAQGSDPTFAPKPSPEEVTSVCGAIRSLYLSRSARPISGLSESEEAYRNAIQGYVQSHDRSDGLYQSIMEGRTSPEYWLNPSTYAPPHEHCMSLGVIPALTPVPTPTPFVIKPVQGDDFAEDVCEGFRDWLRRTASFYDDGTVSMTGYLMEMDPFYHVVLLGLARRTPEELWGDAERDVHAGAVRMWEHHQFQLEEVGATGDIPKYSVLQETCKSRYQIDPFAR